ncbi:hypothetical protein HU200_012609 [Digitaria exilis]|uniref:Uncharacterized protein n=1 Tax=Digitaria exilis TaxID=1010633 RepID=A0A835FER5_9POAL|nr:hypothetical protein HU200_012609 [Digitaria exilis]
MMVKRSIVTTRMQWMAKRLIVMAWKKEMTKRSIVLRKKIKLSVRRVINTDEEEKDEVECETSGQYVNTDEEKEEDEVESETSDQYANTDEEEVDSQDISCDDEDEVEGPHEWNSDDDDILDINKCKWEEEWTIGTMNILGLNPYKDVAFLSQGGADAKAGSCAIGF